MGIKKQLTSGPVYGSWATIPSPIAAEALASSGLDFVILDLEHGSFSSESLPGIVAALQLHQVSALVRVSESRPQEVLRALESGCDGVLAPHIETREDAEKLVWSAKYPPEGSRGMSPYTRVHSFTHETFEDSMRKANAETLVGALVESPLGLQNLPEIMTVKGIDLVYVGLYDLSKSVGTPGVIDSPELLGILGELQALAHEAGVRLGTIAAGIPEAQAFRRLGLKFIAFVPDVFALREYFAKLRRAV